MFTSLMGAPLLPLMVVLWCASVQAVQETLPDQPILPSTQASQVRSQRERMREFVFYRARTDEDLAEGILQGDPWIEDLGGQYNIEHVGFAKDSSRPTQLNVVSPHELANHYSSLTSYDELEECTDDTICMSGVFPPPPSFHVPPPPLPPFVPAASLAGAGQDTSQALDAGDRCSWCGWAAGDNRTEVIPEEIEEWEVGIGGLLAGVAVGSALTGAVLAVVLIRCRRAKILPSGQGGSCLALPRNSWTQTNNRGPRAPAEAKPPEGGPVPAADSTTRTTGWAMKLWRRHVTQDQTLRTVSAYSSENSYTEEPYMNPDSQSDVYAELGGHGLNTYSEIPDPGRPMHEHLVLSDYGYGNSAYALYEGNSEPAESSSTPSSAYYSDVSSDARVNKKKRKKKRSIGRDPSEEIQEAAALRQNVRIAAGSHSNPISVGHLADIPHQADAYPLSVRALPRSYSLERQVIAYPCISCPSCTPINTLPSPRNNFNISPALACPRASYALQHMTTCPIPSVRPPCRPPECSLDCKSS